MLMLKLEVTGCTNLNSLDMKFPKSHERSGGMLRIAIRFIFFIISLDYSFCENAIKILKSITDNLNPPTSFLSTFMESEVEKKILIIIANLQNEVMRFVLLSFYFIDSDMDLFIYLFIFFKKMQRKWIGCRKVNSFVSINSKKMAKCFCFWKK